MLLLLLPYVLWTQGSIPFSGTASLYAIAVLRLASVTGMEHIWNPTDPTN